MRRCAALACALLGLLACALPAAPTGEAAADFRPDHKPILNEFSFPSNLVQGMRFVLLCQALDGEPSTSIRWLKDGRPLEPGELELGEPSAPAGAGASTLVFRRVDARLHAGNYTCLASNQFGSAAYSSQMSVKVPPSWKLEPRDQQARLDDQISIDCQAHGNPNPFIRWKFAGPQLGPAESVQQQQQQQQQLNQQQQQQPANFRLLNSNHHVQTLENGSLVLRHAAKEHEGVYLCEADNGVEPHLAKPIRLSVHAPARVLDEPRLAAGSGAATSGAVDGALRVPANASQVRLACTCSGDPPLALDWLKDGELLWARSGLAPELSGGEPEPAEPAAAAQGRYLASWRWLAPRPAGSAPNQAGSAPGVAWLDTELALVGGAGLEHAASYSCAVRNAFGRSERRARLLVQRPPEPPEPVELAHIGSRSVGLRWRAPADNHSPITRYLVEYRRLGPPGAAAGPEDTRGAPADTPTGRSERLAGAGAAGGLVQHTVHELEPMARYWMRVVAVNALGPGRASGALSLRTEEEVPSAVPSQVDAQVLSSKSIRLRWLVAYSPDSELIDGFFVGYRSLLEASAKPAGAQPASLPPPGRPQGAASGQAAAAAEQSTFTYKTIRWATADAAAGATSGGPEPAPGQQQQTPVEQVAPVSRASQPGPAGRRLVASAFEHVLANLERDTEYTVMIQCFNRKGAGPASDPLVFRTLASDPPGKLLLLADDIGDTSARLTWRPAQLARALGASRSPAEAPEEQLDGFVLAFARLQGSGSASPAANASLAAARVSHAPPSSPAAAPAPGHLQQHQRHQLAPVEGAEQWQALQLAPQQRAHVLRGLECGAAYALRIWAFNKLGRGEPSDLLTLNTRGKAPVAPDRRSLLSANSTQVRVHLAAWYDGGCEILRFVVRYRPRGGHEWTLVSNNIGRDQSSLLIRDLAPATQYELLVGAHNQAGVSEARYRFYTLDASGKPAEQLEGADEADYNNEFDGQLLLDEARAPGRGGPHALPASSSSWLSRAMAGARQALNSPWALVMSLGAFIALLLLLVVHQLGAGHDVAARHSATCLVASGNARAPKSCTSSSGSSAGSALAGSANLGGQLSVRTRGDSPGEPRPGSANLAPQSNALAGADCMYASFCDSAAAVAAANQLDYGDCYARASAASAAAAAAAAAAHAAAISGAGDQYASVRHPLDRAANPHQAPDPNLVQLLLLSGERHTPPTSGMMAAWPELGATMTRPKTAAQDEHLAEAYEPGELARQLVADYARAQRLAHENPEWLSRGVGHHAQTCLASVSGQTSSGSGPSDH